jgi:hypothetical protein
LFGNGFESTQVNQITYSASVSGGLLTFDITPGVGAIESVPTVSYSTDLSEVAIGQYEIRYTLYDTKWRELFADTSRYHTSTPIVNKVFNNLNIVGVGVVLVEIRVLHPGGLVEFYRSHFKMDSVVDPVREVIITLQP